MRAALRLLSAFVIAGAVTAPAAVVTGCYHQHYHGSWSDAEGPYYTRWETETHRDHKEWSARNTGEQQEYWNWRQSHQ
jgi:hypothetical protein